MIVKNNNLTQETKMQTIIPSFPGPDPIALPQSGDICNTCHKTATDYRLNEYGICHPCYAEAYKTTRKYRLDRIARNYHNTSFLNDFEHGD